MNPTHLNTTGCEGNTPVLRDDERIISGACDRPQGGTQTVGAPVYTLKVTNPPEEEECYGN
jgi:hypothetical protein